MSLFGSLFGSGSATADGGHWFPFGGTATSSGQVVNEESALALSAYWLAIKAISEDLGHLPLVTFRKLEGGGKERAKEHPAFDLLLRQANENMAAGTVKEVLTMWALGNGNGYAEIERGRDGSLVALWPMHPWCVTPELQKEPRRRLVYRVRNEQGHERTLRQGQVLHLKGPSREGLCGYSVAHLAAESLGLGLALEQFGGSFFKNGAHLSGAFRHPGKLKDEAFERLKENLTESYTGARNSHKAMILEEGMTWERMGVDPEAAQFLQTRTFTVEDVARWFRMPVEKMGSLLGSSPSRATTEEIQSRYVTDTLLPWFGRWEQEILRKLFTLESDAEHFADFDPTALLRGSAQTRATYLSRMFHSGVMSQNEIRDMEGLNPIEHGDEHYTPVNMVPSRLAATGQAGGRPAPTEPRPRQPERDQEQTDRQSEDAERERETGAPSRRQGAELASLTPVFADAVERLLARERNALPRKLKAHAGDRDGFSAWLAEFASGQRSKAVELFDAPNRTASAFIGAEPRRAVPAAVAEEIDRFPGFALRVFDEQLDPGQSWSGMHDGRTDAVAHAVIEELSETEIDD